MAVSFNYQQDTVTCFIKGEIDHHQSTEIRTQIDHAVGRNTPKMLILDFSGVSFMDSSGIGLVMGRYKKMQSIGGKVKVQNAPPHIKKVMKIAGLSALAIIE
jgi:stage II sporulation protein AA (anti-sigma F factor antagonist)